jgi:hypothetical protein
MDIHHYECNPLKHLVGKPKVKIRHGRIRDRCEDTIICISKKQAVKNALWSHLAEEKGQIVY